MPAPTSTGYSRGYGYFYNAAPARNGAQSLTLGAVANAATAFAPTTLDGKHDYLWSFEGSVQGFTFYLATGAGSNGIVTVTATGAGTDIQIISPAGLSIDGSQFSKVKVRVRRISGGTTWDGTAFYQTSGHYFSGSYYKNVSAPLVSTDWAIIEFDMAALTVGGNDWTTNTILSFRIDLWSNTDSVFEIDWIAIDKPATIDLGALSQSATGQVGAYSSGDSSVTLGVLTFVQDGNVPVLGASAVTLGAPSVTQDGIAQAQGASAVTLGTLTYTQNASAPNTLNGAVTLGALGRSADAFAQATGDHNYVLGVLQHDGAAVAPINMSSSVTLAATTNSGAAVVLVEGGDKHDNVWNFHSDLEGWITDALYTYENGKLIANANGNPDFKVRSPTGLSINGAAYSRVRVRARHVSGGTDWNGIVFYAAAGGHGESGSFYKHYPVAPSTSDWVYLEFDMADLTVGGNDWITNTITAIRIDLWTSPDSVFEIDWIAVDAASNLGGVTNTTDMDVLAQAASAVTLGAVVPTQTASAPATLDGSVALGAITWSATGSVPAGGYQTATLGDITVAGTGVVFGIPINILLPADVVPIDLVPNWSTAYDIIREYKTDIHTSRSGREQRRALRDTARKRLEYTTLLHGQNRNQIMNLLAGWQGNRFVLPEYPSLIYTTSVISPWQASVELGEIPSWLVPGALIVLRNKQGGLEPRFVIDIEVEEGMNRVHFSYGTANSWPAGTQFYSAHIGRIDSNLSDDRRTNQAGSLAVTFDVDPTSEEPNFVSDDIRTYRDLEFFDRRPNWRDGMPVELLADVDKLDFGRGPTFGFEPRPYRQMLYKTRHMAKNSDDLSVLYQFQDRHKGRRGSFYMPTWQNDIRVGEPFAAGDTELYALGDYLGFVRDNIAHRDLVLVDKNRLLHPMRIVDLQPGEGYTRVTFEEELPIGSDDILFISWLPRCRLNSDAMTVSYQTSTVGEIELSVLQLESDL